MVLVRSRPTVRPPAAVTCGTAAEFYCGSSSSCCCCCDSSRPRLLLRLLLLLLLPQHFAGSFRLVLQTQPTKKKHIPMMIFRVGGGNNKTDPHTTKGAASNCHMHVANCGDSLKLLEVFYWSSMWVNIIKIKCE